MQESIRGLTPEKAFSNLSKAGIDSGLAQDIINAAQAADMLAASTTTATSAVTTLAGTTGLLGKLKAGFMGIVSAISPVQIALLALSVGVPIIMEIIDAVHTSREELIEMGEAAKQANQETYSTLESTRSSLAGMAAQYAATDGELRNTEQSVRALADAYTQLSAGVDNENMNVSLSSDEYQDYLNISNQLAELYPSLVSGYDAQGNAILDLGNTASQAADKIMDLYNAQQLSANVDMGKNLNDIFNGAVAQIDGYKEELAGLEEEADKNRAKLDALAEPFVSEFEVVFDGAALGENIEAATQKVYDLANEAGIAIGSNFLGEDGKWHINFASSEGLSADLIDQWENELSAFRIEATETTARTLNDILSQSNATKLQIEDAIKGLTKYYADYISTTDSFSSLPQEIQNAFIANIGNIDYDKMLASVKTSGDVPTYLYSTFIEPLYNLAPEAQQALNDVLSLDINTLNVSEIKSKYTEALANIFPDDTEAQQTFSQVLGLDETITEAEEGLDRLTEIYGDKAKELSYEDIQLGIEVTDEEGALKSYDKFISAIEDKKKEASEVAGTSFMEIMTNQEDGNFNEQIDLFQESFASALSTLEKFKSGDFTNDDLVELYQSFPSLAESADSLEAGLTKVADSNIVNMLAQLDAQIKTVAEDGGDTSGFEKLRQSIIDTVDPSQYDMDTLKKLVTESVIPDPNVSGQAAEEAAERLRKVYERKLDDLTEDFTDEDWQIMYKLSLDPESAQWTLDEWKANVESEKITLGVDLEDTPALDAYREAQESTNQGDRYLEMLDAYKKGAELYKQGLVGTDDFKTIASMFSANGMDDVANWEENVGKIERYMTEDSTGVKNFLDDLTTKTTEAGEALASYNSQTGEWSLNLDDLEANARSMGMSFEWFTSMLGRLEDYGFNLNTFGNVEDGIDKLTELYGDLASESAKLDELQQRKLQGDTSVTDTVISRQQAKIDGIKEQILGAEDLLDQLMNKSLQDYEQEAYGAGEMVKNLLEYRDQTSSSAVKGMLTDQIKELADTYHLDLVFDTEGNITDVVLPEVSAAQDALNQNPLKVSVDEGFLNKVDTGVKANEDSLQGDFDTLGKYSASDIASINFGDGISDAGLEEAEAAVDNILKTLGLSQDEAYALVQALSELGYINLKVENPQQIPEDVQQAIDDNPIVFDNLDSSTITDDFISKVQSGVQSAGDSLQQYINTLKNYTPEEIATIDFNDGDYTEGLEAAESAVDGIADALGVSRDEAAALVEVLAQLGVIQFKAEVENPEAPAAQIQETADQQPIEYKANIELQETPLLPGTENITIQPKADESDTKVTITADNQPALDAIDEVGTYAKNSDAEVSLTANNQSIMDMVEEFNVQAGASEPIQIKASNEQAIGTLNETKEKIDDTTGTMDIDGNNQGAIASANSANTYIEGLNPDIHIGGDTSGLTTDINNSLSGTFKIRLSPVMMLGGIQGQAAGTAHAAGTIPGQVTPGLALWNNYRASIGAYAYGNDWSLNRDEDALVNELGKNMPLWCDTIENLFNCWELLRAL